MFEVGTHSPDGTYTFGRGGNQGARGNDKGGDWFIENVFEELDYPVRGVWIFGELQDEARRTADGGPLPIPQQRGGRSTPASVFSLSLSLVTMTHQYDSSRIGGGVGAHPPVSSLEVALYYIWYLC